MALTIGAPQMHQAFDAAVHQPAQRIYLLLLVDPVAPPSRIASSSPTASASSVFSSSMPLFSSVWMVDSNGGVFAADKAFGLQELE